MVRRLAYAYEDICRSKIWNLATTGRIPFVPTGVGSWWGKDDVEIDVAAVNAETKQLAFGECKFWRNPIGTNVLQHLEKQVKKARTDASFRSYTGEPTYLLFSIEGFTPELEEQAAARNDVVLVR